MSTFPGVSEILEDNTMHLLMLGHLESVWVAALAVGLYAHVLSAFVRVPEISTVILFFFLSFF